MRTVRGCPANYEIVSSKPGELILRDIGPWNVYQTVTNAAEEVIEQLRQDGRIPDGTRVLYYDSGKTLDELLIRDGRFAGFAPGPRRGEKA
jgi:hypothetical protein